MSVLHMTDDLDMAGHHIVDWRYLSDLPQGGATTGQALVWNGTSWAPGAAVGGSLTGAVNSIFGRDGDVVAEAGDYTVDQIADAHAEAAVSWEHARITLPEINLKYLPALNGDHVPLNFVDSLGGVLAYLRYDYVEDWLEVSPMLKGAYFWATSSVITNTVAESTADVGVTVDGMLIKDGVPYTDVISEDTAGAGVTVDGVLLKDFQVSTDVINELTAAAGVTVDGIVLKDSGATSTWTTLGGKTQFKAALNLTNVGFTDFGTTYVCYDSAITIDAGAGSGATQTVYGYKSTMVVTDNTPVVLGDVLTSFYGTIDADGRDFAYGSGQAPVYFGNLNPGSGQNFENGYLSVSASGTAGTVISAYTRANVTGAAVGIGYRGYAAGASGATGTLTGVNGYAVATAGNTATSITGLSATIINTAGLAANKLMGLHVENHALIGDASLIVVGGTPANPAAVTTTHLNFATNGGEAYIEGNAEIDGELFMDGNTSCSISAISASANAGAATYIIVNATSGAVTVTLPAVSGKAGRLYTIKKIDASANAVTVDGNGAETIDGVANKSLAAQYDAIRVICNGSTWWVV